MKNVCKIPLLFGAFVAAFSQPTLVAGQSAVSQQAEGVKPPFTLTISYNQQNPNIENAGAQIVESGRWVAFRVRKTNITDHEIIKLSDAPGASGYMYDVRDGGGNPVEFKKHKDLIDGKMMTSGGENRIAGTNDMVLQPGESKINFEPLSSHYEMDKPGTYTIQVSEHISNDPASEVVKSNILTITVVAPEPPAGEAK
jgi:hypothetical protein